MSRIVLTSVAILSIGIQLIQAQKQNRQDNKPPRILKIESSAEVLQSQGQVLFGFCSPRPRRSVSLVVSAEDPDGDTLTFQYWPSAGEVFGHGPSVTWRIGDQPFGTYSVVVKVTDAKGAEATEEVRVKVVHCTNYGISGPPCPLIDVSASDESTYRGEKIVFDVNVSPGHFQTRPDYVWAVTSGRILKGQHTPRIEVEPTGEDGSTVTATVDVEGFDAACSRKASASTVIKE